MLFQQMKNRVYVMVNADVTVTVSGTIRSSPIISHGI
jgi:hypothetical protein